MATVTAPAPVSVAATPQPGFFERKWPAALILSTFPLLTLPLAAAMILSPDRRFLLVYIWLFGLTHFVLTLSIYLQSGNLRHFAASNRNILLFFVVPLAIMMGFYLIGFFELRAKFPAAAVLFAAGIRLMDFNHLNRQSFGVYQLFKARGGIRLSPAVKRSENAYFACLTALLLITYLAGGVSPLVNAAGWRAMGTGIATTSPALLPMVWLRVAGILVSAAAITLGAVSIGAAIRAWRVSRGSGVRLSEVAGYIGIQTLAALLAVVSAPLYFATLSIHYVEYHVLMFPRCFHSSLDEGSGLDHWFAALRRYRGVFYAVLLVAAGMVMYVMILQTNPTGALRANPIRYRAVVSIFDGLFVFHYFVEMLIWRFSDPFFRRTLTPLYFSPRPKTA
jgi:hypothetical protein